MSDATTIARPYAKALFQLALETQKMAIWTTILNELAQAVKDTNSQAFLCNPAATTEQQAELVLSVCSKANLKIESENLENFVRLLAANRRLLILPAICSEYELLRAEQEKTLAATVISFAALSSEQEKQLIQSLSQRLQREVTLDVTIDTSLLGGAIICAGDLVIDGSVRGTLNKLRSSLAA